MFIFCPPKGFSSLPHYFSVRLIFFSHFAGTRFYNFFFCICVSIAVFQILDFIFFSFDFLCSVLLSEFWISIYPFFWTFFFFKFVANKQHKQHKHNNLKLTIQWIVCTRSFWRKQQNTNQDQEFKQDMNLNGKDWNTLQTDNPISLHVFNWFFQCNFFFSSWKLIQKIFFPVLELFGWWKNLWRNLEFINLQIWKVQRLTISWKDMNLTWHRKTF